MVCSHKAVDASAPDPHVFDELDDFWTMFLRSRSLCGSIPESILGAKSVRPGGFYYSATLYEAIVFCDPITNEARLAHNRIAAWTNENFVIRLWAILESHGYTKPIRSNAEHSDAVRLLKRLRQHFAHGSGVYDSSKSSHRKLRRDVLTMFPKVGDPQGIPLAIDSVLEPMLEACRSYARAVFDADEAPVQLALRADGQER